jgi:hypothetical protein
MSQYDVEIAYNRLRQLGVDVSTLNQDYYKIPLENIDLAKIEKAEPTKTKVVSKHTIIVDSRQRDYSIYPSGNNYLINLMEPHRNVERIELIAAMMPKTEYNINSENNLLIVNIGGTVVNGVIVGGVTKKLYLTEGQYPIGTNLIGSTYIPNGTTALTGIMAELKSILNSYYLPAISVNFNVFISSTPGNVGGTGNYASILNRIVITNTTDNFIIDFTNTLYNSGSPFRVLGFNKQIYDSSLLNQIYATDNLGTCIPVTLQTGIPFTISIPSLVGIYDYDLNDDPKYIIMQLDFGNKSAERVESVDIATNQKFAVIIYDANEPDNILSAYSTTGSITFDTKRPGKLKALKGSDFDKKIINFDPPITLENFKISFYKYDNTFYQFHNREHLLTFELDIADYDPKYRY